MKEKFVDINGFEGLYKISNQGNVLSIIYKNHRILKPNNDKDGYLKVCLRKGNKNYCRKIHRLVAEHFIAGFEIGKQVNHINHDIKNNNIINLEWVTVRENQAHRSFNKKHSSNFLGVSYHKANKKWTAHIGINLKSIYLGIYESEELAYNARMKYISENKIESKYL